VRSPGNHPDAMTAAAMLAGDRSARKFTIVGFFAITDVWTTAASGSAERSFRWCARPAVSI
jgi:hypothetical protein